jgi:hypothetical protein
MTWLLLLLLLVEADPDADEPDDDEPDPDEPDDDGDEPGDDEEELTAEELADAEATRNPIARVKSLLAANKRLAAKVSKLEGGTSNGGRALRDARLESAFLRSAIELGHDSVDLDAAWTLLEGKQILSLVKVKADGTVKGMDKAWSTLLDRYPYLVSDDANDDESEPRPRVPKPTTGTPRKKPGATGIDKMALQERFPKLRRRRSV